MTEAKAVGEDPRIAVLVATIDELWDGEMDVPDPREEAARLLEVLDRFDEGQGVVRVNLTKHRVMEQDRDRLRGALFAAVQTFEAYAGPVMDNGVQACTPSIPIPTSMVEGWRIIAEGGG